MPTSIYKCRNSPGDFTSKVGHTILDSAIRFVQSTHGVHCGSKRGETDIHTQGYKDPPVPRRLVGESQVPPSLSSAYTVSSKDVPAIGLAGEYRKIRTGA